MSEVHRRTGSIVILSLVVLLIGGAVPSSGASAETPAVASTANGRVTILRDEYGVPHVYASTERSLWYGVGYAQGQDRLWQAEVLRRTAKGTTAEIFGLEAVEGDISTRALFGPEERFTALLESASDQAKLALKEFAAGMNTWIEEATATGQLPIEFTVFGFTPDPWVEEDSIATLAMLLFNFGEAGWDELTNSAHLEELILRFGAEEGAKVFADTHWLNDPDATTTVPVEVAIQSSRRSQVIKAELPTAAASHLPDASATRAALERNFARAGLKRGPASNAMVISPELSADGRALLLGGPQMGYSAPQINHEIGIHRAGINVTGMEIAGVPWLPIAVTDEYAWSLTTGGTDNMDWYVEVVNPDNPNQYLFEGQWIDFECRLETFGVSGAPDVTETLCETGHGPVLGADTGIALTLKRAVHGFEMETFEVFFGLLESRSVSDVDATLAGFAACLNFFYADRRGNIAYWHMGRIPLRAEGDDPWLPHDGTGSAEWQGFIPWEEMPHTVNPAQGWLSSWNNKPALDWDNSTIGFWNWGPVQRVNTLNNLLSQVSPSSATTETLEEFNVIGGWTTDTPSGSAATVFVSTLIGDMLAEVDPAADPRLADIVALLTSWDWLQVDLEPMDNFYDSPGVAIFNTWWQIWVDRVFADDLGDTLLPNVVGNLTYRMLAEAPALPLLHDYLGGETAEQAMTGALITALDDLTSEYGSADPADWLQPIAEIVWEPIGVGVVPNTIWMNRGTYNHIVHLGPGRELYGQNVVSPGQSGDPFSPHFADQLPLYSTWTYKPMRLKRSDLNGFIESKVILHPDH